MSSPKNLTREGRSSSANQQLDIEETMPQSARNLNQNSLQNNNINNSSINNLSSENINSQGRSSTKQGDNMMVGETIPSKLQQEQQVIEEKIPENKCKVKGHKKEDLAFICTVKDCEQVLMCQRCKKKHKKDHQGNIKSLDNWFNNMFGRRVEDSDNNKVSRKCGMNLGKLQDLLKTFKEEIDARKQTIEKQTDQFIETIKSYIKQKQSECLKRLDGHYKIKDKQIEDYQQTYKKLKGLNRFTILENLKRQHNPNQEAPPLIPIHSILRFLLENEKQYSDSTQIENQHKGFSKLIRDTDSLEQAINNETKQFSKLASTDEGQPDYMIRDSPVIQRIHDYIDFLFFFEKGIPKKPQQFFRSGTLNFDEDEYQNQLNSQAMGASINLNFTNQVQGMQSSRPVSGSVYRNVYNNSNGGDSTGIRRLTVDEVLKYSRPREMSQSNMLKQIQQQDEGDFILQKQMEQKQNLGMKNCTCCEEEKEEVEYECLVQENFNNASFIDFKNDSIRVFGDQSVQLFEVNEGKFNKKDNLKAQQQIISHDQEMYEIGAIEEVYLFQSSDSYSFGKPQQIRGQDGFNKKGSEQLIEKNSNDDSKNDTILADENTASLIDLNQSTQLGNNSQKKKLPILIIGLKSDPAKIEIWDMNKNEKVYQQLQAHECSITCIQIIEVIQNKSVLFAVGSYDGIIKTWLLQCTIPEQALPNSTDINSSDKISPIYTLTQQLVMKSHTDFVTSMILFRIKDDPAKEYLISAGSDKKMILWNWKNEEPSKIDQNSSGAAPQNNEPANQNTQKEKDISEIDASASSTNTPANNQTEIKTEEKKKPMFLKKSIKLISFPKNQVNSNNSNSSNNEQNAANEKSLRKPIKVMDNVHSDKINCFEKLDVGFLASGSSDNTIKIWDMDTQTEQKVLQNKYIVNSICRLKKGTLVCSANNVKMGIYLVNIWNWESGQIIGTIKGHTNRISKILVIPNIFVETTNESIYNKIITCERNKVIRVWKQFNVDIDACRPLNSQEDELINSPSSIRSHISRTYSFYGGYNNAAEDFFNMYHIEMDPSLTPKINMTRIASSTNIPLGPHDKTPISNLIRGPNFNGQTTPQNSNLYFSQAQSQQQRNSFNPTFSQQNNLVEKQYYSVSQQVQQSRQQPIITPPKNNSAFQFNSDDQQQSSNNIYSSISQVPSIQLTTSPQKQRTLSMQQNGSNQQQGSQQLMTNYQQTTTPTNNQFVQALDGGNYPINQNMVNIPLNSNMINVQLNTNLVNSSMVNIPVNQNISNVPLNQSVISVPLYDYMVNHSIFQQQINNNPDLQQAMEQITIQNSLPENQKEYQQQIQINQCQNIAPQIDLLIAQEQQKLLEQAIQEQLVQRKRNYSETLNMLAPLEEANESEYNSPVESQSEFKSPYGSMSSFSIDSSKFKNYSRENSNESCDISLFQHSPAQKGDQDFDSKQIVGKPGLLKYTNFGNINQINERSPASESSNSSGNNSDQLPQISRDYSNNSQDIILSDKYSASSTSPNSSDYQKDSIIGQSRDPIVKCNSLENPSIKKEIMNYEIKLNGVHKYGSLEIAERPSDLLTQNDTIKINDDRKKQINNNNQNNQNKINNEESKNNVSEVKNQNQNKESQPSSQNTQSITVNKIENQPINKNKEETENKQDNDKKIINLQYLQVENPEKQKQDEIQPSKESSSYNLLPPEDQNASAISSSAPTSPQQTSNPLLKNKAALSKTKKSSRNIFQN